MKRPTTILIAAALATTLGTPILAGEPYRIREREITASQRQHWAFRPLLRPKLPALKYTEEVANPIDYFIRAKLEVQGLQPLPAAGRATLIRRLSFGLTGLPPTPARVRAFIENKSPDAYEKLVDQFLASPAYGERWAQHWLDLARFAETDGFEHDKMRKDAWRYRDWVIDALNRDMPYDEFVRLQIAGDEIRPDKNGTHVATGFLMSGPDMPDINRADERRHVLLNEMTSTVGAVFMGLTLECAQCHNHRYDALSQADFYRLRAFFANTLPNLKRNVQHAMSVREPKANAPDTHFMIRGDFQRRGPVLAPAFLRIVNPEKKIVAEIAPGAKSSMRRRVLADWLTRPNHPLTARVIVNRIWMHHFGNGLSNTPSDFGIMGDEPTHPQLLDWLATELVREKWSLKKLHRLIVTSETYRRASHPHESTWNADLSKEARTRWQTAKAKDPKNKLLWRMNRIRLDGEAIRDAMLSSANRLSNRRGGAGVRPPLPQEIVATLLRNQWNVSPNEEDHRRRSIYIFARRNLRFPIFEAFDRPDGNASCSRRSQSTTAPQALILLNAKFSNQMARAVAANAKSANSTPGQIRYCYQQILARSPTASELAASREFITEQPSPPGDGSALEDFCLALFNLNEFVYVD